MAALVFLDPQDKHHGYSQKYDADIFARFTERGRCLLHIMSQLLKENGLHFFLPNEENALVGARNTVFKNTIFYIYCNDMVSLSEMQRLYNYPVLVKSFHIDWLPTYLQQAIIGCLIERAECRQYEPDEFDTALQMAKLCADNLADELQQHMIMKTGVQPCEEP